MYIYECNTQYNNFLLNLLSLYIHNKVSLNSPYRKGKRYKLLIYLHTVNYSKKTGFHRNKCAALCLYNIQSENLLMTQVMIDFDSFVGGSSYTCYDITFLTLRISKDNFKKVGNGPAITLFQCLVRM